jgi:hypothetical protein
VDVQLHVFLTSTLIGGEWSGSRLGRFTPDKASAVLGQIGDVSDPRTGLDDVESRKVLTRIPTPGPSSPWPVAIPTALFRHQQEDRPYRKLDSAEPEPRVSCEEGTLRLQTPNINYKYY